MLSNLVFRNVVGVSMVNSKVEKGINLTLLTKFWQQRQDLVMFIETNTLGHLATVDKET